MQPSGPARELILGLPILGLVLGLRGAGYSQIGSRTVSVGAHAETGGRTGDADMTRADMVAHLAERTGLTKAQTGQVLDELAQLAYVEARNGFVIPGIGKLVLVDRSARKGRNPATGETIDIPAKTVVKFRVAKVCKDALLPS